MKRAVADLLIPIEEVKSDVVVMHALTMIIVVAIALETAIMMIMEPPVEGVISRTVEDAREINEG